MAQTKRNTDNSRRITEILIVAEKMKANLTAAIDTPDGTISMADARAILRKTYAETAAAAGLSESTIRDKCTRQIDCSADTFFEELMDYYFSGRKLAERLKKYSCNPADDACIESL